MEKKITRATIKSFIKKNLGSLYIDRRSNFDGMVDCVMPVVGGFEKVRTEDRYTEKSKEYTLGVCGAWFVGQSRDSFEKFENSEFVGFYVSNCCGSFVLAIKN